LFTRLYAQISNNIKVTENFFRYVDTFNRSGGTPANSFQSPAISSSKPVTGPNPKFFVPTPVSPGEETVQTTEESIQQSSVINEKPPTSLELFAHPPTTLPSSAGNDYASFPSVDNITHEIRSGSLNDASNSMMQGIKLPGETLGLPASFSSDPPSNQFSQGCNPTDALHEVEL
jgi:hypothetical protein